MKEQTQPPAGAAGDSSMKSSSGGPEMAVRSSRSILFFWAPLALQWIMMAVEGPFLAAVIARMGDPAYNLAAYGVAFAFAILIESPVIMLMSASTALVEDAESYRRLRNFANSLNIGVTLLVLVVLIPPLFRAITDGLLGLPDTVAGIVYGSLWFLLPWPAAIGYRRFLHGILIRSGRTRLVAYGTLLRLAGMATMALALYALTSLPGAWVAAMALSTGVVVEAVAARFMAVGAVARLQVTSPPLTSADAEPSAEVETAAEAGGGAEQVVAEEAVVSEEVSADPAEATPRDLAGRLRTRGESALRRTGTAARALRRRVAVGGYGDIARFYFPLALTSLIGLSVQPLLTFFMGRAPQPLESLAVFPVVHALSFLFRAPGLAFQEVVIALSGRQLEHIKPLQRFGIGLGFTTTGLLALVAFTPFAAFWFEVVSGLQPDLAALATGPARIAVPLGATTVLLAFQQAVLVQTRRTRQITAASFFEVAGIAILFTYFGWTVGLFGASAAMLALVGGRLFANGYLLIRVRQVLRS